MDTQTIALLSKSINVVNTIMGHLGGGHLMDGKLVTEGGDKFIKPEGEYTGNGVEVTIQKIGDNIRWKAEAVLVDEHNNVVPIMDGGTYADDLDLDMTAKGRDVATATEYHPVAIALAKVFGGPIALDVVDRLNAAITAGATQFISGNGKLVCRDGLGFKWYTHTYA